MPNKSVPEVPISKSSATPDAGNSAPEGRSQGLPTTLSEITDRKLLSQVKKLTRLERVSTLQILLHLIEIERRELHLALGYRSMFDYCVRCLRYSASGAGRRIQTARCLARHPEVYVMLERNEVNVTTVSLVSKALTDENKNELLRRIANKTQREVERLVARFGPPVAHRDRVRSVCVQVEATAHVPLKKALELDGENSSGNSGSLLIPHSQNGSDSAPVPGVASDKRVGLDRADLAHGEASRSSNWPNDSLVSPDSLRNGVDSGQVTGGLEGLSRTRLEQRVQIQFLAKPSLINKYQEVRALLSHRLPHTSFAEVFEVVLEAFIERNSPRKREERRTAREERRREKADGAGVSNSPTRHIPAAVRDAVFLRDGGRCTYVGAEGTRCGSKMGVEIDHIVPFAKGGGGTVSNLRLLCGKHNRLEAERLLGVDMKRYRRQE